MYPLITRQDFCKYIDVLKKIDEKEDLLTETFQRIDDMCGEVFMFSEEYSTILNLLENIMCVEDCLEYGSIISYFCYELSYGKNYYPGCFIDEHDKEIDISTSEKLYEYIVEDYLAKHKD